MGWVFDLDEEADFAAAGDLAPLSHALDDAFIGIFEIWAGQPLPGHEPLRDRELARLAYGEYLRTEHWRVVRARALLRAGGMCQRCYAETRRLDVHHLTYLRLGRERESDLQALCRDCHASAHELSSPPDPPEPPP